MIAQQERGHRLFAAGYDRFMAGSERRIFAPIRMRLLADLRGRVLEIGSGTGASLPYYSPGAQVVGIEPDPYMLRRARARLEELGVTNIELRQGPAERLPFEDASFDHVASTLVLCTVRDLAQSIAEARRVLKPDGSLRFLEHIRNDGSAWGTVQDAIAPVWRWCAAGCNPNRRTVQALTDAGFVIEWQEQVRVGPGTPAVYGVARPG
jgi:ubiquinone/menaquinone biosynthesis C-methylase UbiE